VERDRRVGISNLYEGDEWTPERGKIMARGVRAHHFLALAGICVVLCVLLLVLLHDFSPSDQDAATSFPGRISQEQASGANHANLAHAPLAFIENRGQADTPVRYLIRGPRGTVYFTPEEVVFDLFVLTGETPGTLPTEPGPGELSAVSSRGHRGVVLRQQFLGASSGVVVSGDEKLPGTVNVFRGKDPSRWQHAIPMFSRVLYRNLYPGVQLAFSGTEGNLSFRFVVDPNRSADRIRYRFVGAEGVTLADDGSLLIETALGSIVEKPPRAYQETSKESVSIHYTLYPEGEIGFQIGPYDCRRQLVITIGS
jgi:hypothetical protein